MIDSFVHNSAHIKISHNKADLVFRKLAPKPDVSLTMDNVSFEESGAFRETESNYFEDDGQFTVTPHWICDNDLKNSETETLGAAEEQFWLDLIEKYLQPIEPTDEQKVSHLETNQ